MSSENIIDEQVCIPFVQAASLPNERSPSFLLQKVANLARIRDNQRRSRARRKEYLQELEERYRTCEQLGIEASVEMQSAARRVIEENFHLRSMLKQHGYTDVDIDRTLMERASAPPAVADLEALFGQRRRPISNRDSSSSSGQIQKSSRPDTHATPPMSAMRQWQSQAPEQPHVKHLLPEPQPNVGPIMSASVMAAPSTVYSDQSQWQIYAAQAAYPIINGVDTSRMSHQYEDMPSIQDIKSEIGYGPEEEIDGQSTDAEYSLADEHGYGTAEHQVR